MILKTHILLIFEQNQSYAYLLNDVAYSIGSDPSMGIWVNNPHMESYHTTLFQESISEQTCYRVTSGSLACIPSGGEVWVNGLRCANYVLRDGDQIQFGSHVQGQYFNRSLHNGVLVLPNGDHIQPTRLQTRGAFPGQICLQPPEDQITIIPASEVRFCGIYCQTTASLLLGATYQGLPFTLDRSFPSRQKAIEYLVNRLNHPLQISELCFLLQKDEGYQLCLHHPYLEFAPYPSALWSLCSTLRSTGLIANRRWRLRIFQNCFVGSEAVTWLAHHMQLSRQEATALWQECEFYHLLVHVLGEQRFLDEPFYYRLLPDGNPEKRLFQGISQPNSSGITLSTLTLN